MSPHLSTMCGLDGRWRGAQLYAVDAGQARYGTAVKFDVAKYARRFELAHAVT